MTTSINAAHRTMLLDSAISAEVLDASDIRSTPQGIEFPWTDGTSATIWQKRPDSPRVDDEGRTVKYEFPKGSKVPFSRLRDGVTYDRLIIAEGTKQSWAVLSHAPAEFAVYGMSGCWGFTHADLTVAEGRDVFLLLDADFESNQDVWVAAEQLTKQLKRHGAKSVAYVATTGTGKQGVDDVLADLPEGKRAHMLKLWLSQAATKLPKRPRGKRPTLSDQDTEAARYFRQRDKPLMLQPADFATDLLAEVPAALTPEGNIALYRGGVYSVDDNAFLSLTVERFGNYFTPSIHNNVSMVVRAKLAGAVLPENMADPLLNCVNGMVDLRTGELSDHDPQHMSYVQVSAAYEPDTATPTYDAWLRDALRQDGASDADVDALVADIEETAGTMLDPSRTPSKALFLFGPSRSGKSTFLRLLKAIAGSANTSAVTLHQLSTDQFAAANLYGKMLNVAADLSNKHVSDLSLFKMITGEDAVQANRKYGSQFEFTNQALVAFSANELPTVSEASRAYAERMKPFSFPNSFAGREDKHLEAKLMSELPGILARWVKAYGRFLARGGYNATDTATQANFEAQSDRVVQFFQDMCTVTEAEHGQTLDTDHATGRRDVAIAFNAWAERNGGSKMGERAFFNRFEQLASVVLVRRGSKGPKGYNVTVATADDDSWQDAPAEPLTAAERDAFDAITEAIELDATVPFFGPRTAPAPVAVSTDPFAVEDLGYNI